MKLNCRFRHDNIHFNRAVSYYQIKLFEKANKYVQIQTNIPIYMQKLKGDKHWINYINRLTIKYVKLFMSIDRTVMPMLHDKYRKDKL